MRSVAAVSSIALHACLLVGMSAIPQRVGVAATKIVEMRVVNRPPPVEVPKVVPIAEEKPKAIPAPQVRPKLVAKKTVEKVVADEPKPPVEEKPEPKVPPKGFSIDMSSTVVGGGVAAPAVEGGGNMFADPNDKKLEPGKKTTAPQEATHDTGKGQGTAPRGNYQVTRLPEFIGNERDRTPPYPDDARAKEISGQVVLKVFVDESGRVADVRVMRKLDPSCDAIAVKWAKERFRFKPAMAGDQSVGMWIDVPVTFVIDR